MCWTMALYCWKVNMTARATIRPVPVWTECFFKLGGCSRRIRYDGGGVIAFVEQPRRGNVSRNRQKAPEPEKPARVNQACHSGKRGRWRRRFVLGRIQRPYSLLSPGGAWTAAPWDFTWGHYYNDYQSAKRDLMGRAQEQLNDQNEGSRPLRAKAANGTGE